MSYQEIAKNMIDRLPDNKMIFIINMLEGLVKISCTPVYPEFTPNSETLETFAETDDMIRTGNG